MSFPRRQNWIVAVDGITGLSSLGMSQKKAVWKGTEYSERYESVCGKDIKLLELSCIAYSSAVIFRLLPLLKRSR